MIASNIVSAPSPKTDTAKAVPVVMQAAPRIGASEEMIASRIRKASGIKKEIRAYTDTRLG